MYSDNGGNFEKGNTELIRLHALYHSSFSSMENFAVDEGIKWHFNPPSAPHFGGIWEAAVKSVKNHLIKTIGNEKLTFEEMYTLLSSIEATLNSRPLCPLSTDPNDFSVLTPGHFLVGGPLNSLPEPDLSHVKLPHLDIYQNIQRLQESFWNRWKTEVLAEYQKKSKWLKERKNLEINDCVLIVDDNKKSKEWRMGRIIKLHPGSDNKVRAVTIKTSTGEMERPIHKLCLLPLKSE